MIIKRILIITALIFNLMMQAQVLNVGENIQEQSNWCWAATSKTILDYYGIKKNQCEITEYARQVIIWTNLGSANCCDNPTLGCNNTNNLRGTSGNIEDFLTHFRVRNYIKAAALSLNASNSEINVGRPFTAGWRWYSGGGHFVVVYGVVGNDLYYMNPGFGEAFHISRYNWFPNDGVHTWTHTNLTKSALGIPEISNS